MKARQREDIELILYGLAAVGLSFINFERINVFVYRLVLGMATVGLLFCLLLAICLAPLRSWQRITKISVVLILLFLHPFTNRLWLDNRWFIVIWVISSGYVCWDSRHPKRLIISLVLSLIATPFSFFDSLTMVAYWIVAANGLLHIFLNKDSMDRFCAFALCVGSSVAALSLIPGIAAISLGSIPGLIALVRAFVGEELGEMIKIQKDNEATFLRERELARIEEMALKEEIRPHFLLNALNNLQVSYHESIENGRLLLDDLVRLEQMVIDVTKKDTIPLKQEIDILHGLVDLYIHERKHPIQFDLDIADENLPLPPLLLVPMVENSLQHSGIMQREDGRIRISEWNDFGFATILIGDNGLERPLPSPSRGIGLSNVQRRVGLLDEGKMSIESDEEGTAVRITFRLLEDVEEKRTA